MSCTDLTGWMDICKRRSFWEEAWRITKIGSWVELQKVCLGTATDGSFRLRQTREGRGGGAVYRHEVITVYIVLRGVGRGA